MNSNASGKQAEAFAATFLQQKGLKLLEKNYRCRFGEIDLVLLDGDTLVFAEVRMRRNRDFGGPEASITARKRAKLLRSARHYLGGRRNFAPCRFDAVLLSGANEVLWIKNAFGE